MTAFRDRTQPTTSADDSELRADGLVMEKSHAYGGVHRYYRFPNGRGASVIRCGISYGAESGLWELAVLDAAGSLDYSTPITNDVLGHLTVADVNAALAAIAALPSEAP